MKRRDAGRRHRLYVTVIAALSAILLILLAAVVPRVESMYEARAIDPPGTTQALFQISRIINERLWIFVLLLVVFIGLLWTSYGLLHRQNR